MVSKQTLWWGSNDARSLLVASMFITFSHLHAMEIQKEEKSDDSSVVLTHKEFEALMQQMKNLQNDVANLNTKLERNKPRVATPEIEEPPLDPERRYEERWQQLWDESFTYYTSDNTTKQCQGAHGMFILAIDYRVHQAKKLARWIRAWWNQNPQ